MVDRRAMCVILSRRGCTIQSERVMYPGVDTVNFDAYAADGLHLHTAGQYRVITSPPGSEVAVYGTLPCLGHLIVIS